MSRSLSGPSRTVPYLASWTAANLDLTSTTAATAPVRLAGLSSAAYVQFCFAGASASKTFSWQLILADQRWLDASSNAAPMRAIEFTTAAGARRTAAAGAAENYFHADKIIDIGGIGETADAHWYLALAGIDTDTAAYLLSYGAARLQGSP